MRQAQELLAQRERHQPFKARLAPRENRESVERLERMVFLLWSLAQQEKPGRQVSEKQARQAPQEHRLERQAQPD